MPEWKDNKMPIPSKIFVLQLISDGKLIHMSAHPSEAAAMQYAMLDIDEDQLEDDDTPEAAVRRMIDEGQLEIIECDWVQA